MNKQHGGFVIPIFVILAIIIIFLLMFRACQNARYPGGEPLQIDIRPGNTTLAPNVPVTFTVAMALTHPLPAGLTKSWKVRIDEDDIWDDELNDSVTVTYNPNGPPYAVGTFTLTCKNLNAADSTFDLEGKSGTSYTEKEHQVHGEHPGIINLASGNIKITCATPVPTDGE